MSRGGPVRCFGGGGCVGSPAGDPCGFFGGSNAQAFQGSLGREVSLIFMGNSGEFFIIILSRYSDIFLQDSIT